ncbi:MAG: response regulator [Bacteroidetes bacterium]|nr:response regulator [Bacteroidota bacterium]
MTTSKTPKCILLVDDDPDDIFLHQIVIQESGVPTQAIVAENGEVAWRYFDSYKEDSFQKPDIIFLDINMPRIDGFEFLSLFKTLSPDFRKDIKVVILSTSSNPYDQEKAASILPGLAYHTKPLTQKLFLSLMNETSSLSNA